ncbi:MAG: hypothetical protein COB14_06455 [Alphaproteobacteria bacterium]|nr:MAG: hypothetical protein COB14_06455 [Alphaproteobacteria bacterium]
MSETQKARPRITNNFAVSAMSFSLALTLSACSGGDGKEIDIAPTQDKVLSAELNEMRHTFQCYDGPYDIEREGFNSVDANVREKSSWIDSKVWNKWQNRLDGKNLETDHKFKSTYYFEANEINYSGRHSTLKAAFSKLEDEEQVAFLVVGGSDRNQTLKNGALKVSMQRAAGFLPYFEEAGIHPDRVCIIPEGREHAGAAKQYEDRHVTITAFSLE